MKEQKADRTCPICGMGTWMSPGVVVAELAGNEYGRVPMVQVVCQCCGYVQLFSAAIALGETFRGPV